MKENTKPAVSRPVPGQSREAEEAQLRQIIEIAQRNLEKTDREVEKLSGELHELMESYGPKDKEALSMLRNTQLQFQESRRDLLRLQKARKKPYFGRIDFKDPRQAQEESYYIGRVGIAKTLSEPAVIDWRAPVASVYYENKSGRCSYTVKNEGTYQVDLKLKRSYEIENDRLVDFFDSDVVANDTLLTKYLAKNKSAVLGEIIATIQEEQNAIIRKSPKMNLIVQGVAGSGKTTVAMHRISYILYNYEDEFLPRDFYIIGSNEILLNYITSALPDLDVYGVTQMTMEQLFIRLLYEDWDEKLYKICNADASAAVKGSLQWINDLEVFCDIYERKNIPLEDVTVENTGTLLMDSQSIIRCLKERKTLSMQEKINTLNAILMSKLENELSGRYVTYPLEERRSIQRQYRWHFGKKAWKGSIFQVYEEFLADQAAKGISVSYQENIFDLYDLAALAYIYKRIKEADGIREASHVIIDEAQDFGMMAYGALDYCLRGCTYTIMGDVSQNIHYGYGLNDWEELKRLILPADGTGFCLLKKSYRNTVEISNFATNILRHGSFAVYPVEPLRRHGSPVAQIPCDSDEQMIQETKKAILQWQAQGRETIAVICRDASQAAFVSSELKKYIALADSDPKTAAFTQGVMVLTVEYTKGLEFDCVVLYDPSVRHYPAEDSCVKLLYVAATRALHELAIVWQGELTPLIAEPVDGAKKMTMFTDKGTGMDNNAAEGKKAFPGKSTVSAGKTLSDPGDVNEAEAEKTAVSQKTPALPVNASKYHFGDCPEVGRLRPVPGKSLGNVATSQNTDWAIKEIKKTKKCLYLISRAGTLRLSPLAPGIIRVQFKSGKMEPFKAGYWNYQPERLPDWSARAGQTFVEAVTKELAVRIDKKTGALAFFNRAGKRLLTEDVRMPRLVREQSGCMETWNYFSWDKGEKLYAKGILPSDLERMNNKARYISFGGMKMRMPLILSDAGYGIAVAAGQTVMCCDISMYGTFLFTDKSDQIDYYFLYGKGDEGILEMYKRCCSQ